MKGIHKIKKLLNLGKDISLKDISILIKASKSIHFEKGDILIDQNSKKNDVFFIKKGLVRCFHINDKGEEITFQLIPEYHLVSNAHFILLQEPSKFYYVALEPTSVFALNYEVIQTIISNNPKLESKRKVIFQRIMKQVFTRVESFVLLSPEERYLKYVKDFSNIVNRAPDKYIANVLGITPVSLSRIRKRISSKK